MNRRRLIGGAAALASLGIMQAPYRAAANQPPDTAKDISRKAPWVRREAFQMSTAGFVRWMAEDADWREDMGSDFVEWQDYAGKHGVGGKRVVVFTNDAIIQSLREHFLPFPVERGWVFVPSLRDNGAFAVYGGGWEIAFHPEPYWSGPFMWSVYNTHPTVWDDAIKDHNEWFTRISD